ncbi:MAG: hypothetical protein ICV66_04995 [Chitinophagaceae bacterium]|nr:hypothetical protein [Chitinophagaceae bacterium]
MKISILTSALALFILVSSFECQKQTTNTCYRGRLEVKGICMNYTISVVSGKVDTSLVEQTWTDPQTGKTYHNAFGLGSPCSFPADIKEGDEFYFKVENTSDQNCIVCMAYYPTPSKHLSIKVMQGNCEAQ